MKKSYLQQVIEKELTSWNPFPHQHSWIVIEWVEMQRNRSASIGKNNETYCEGGMMIAKKLMCQYCEEKKDL